MNLHLQAFDLKNKEYLWQLYIKAMQHHIDNIWGWESDWQSENFEQNLAEYTTLLIKCANNRIGYIQYNINVDSIYINMIILEKNYQSNGFVKEVLDLIQSSHKNLPIALKCFRVNKSAYEFYIRNGFVEKKRDEFFVWLEKH